MGVTGYGSYRSYGGCVKEVMEVRLQRLWKSQRLQMQGFLDCNFLAPDVVVDVQVLNVCTPKFLRLK